MKKIKSLIVGGHEQACNILDYLISNNIAEVELCIARKDDNGSDGIFPSLIHTAKKPETEIPETVKVPDFAHLLPEEIRSFTGEIHDADHLSFVQGGGHGGSHPHMANEFVSALIQDRDPWPNAITSANWTCVGLCAHESTKIGGKIVHLPSFTLG